MTITHQSLKELAQRPDEEVVQLWLEQRGLSMPTSKPTHTPLPTSGQLFREGAFAAQNLRTIAAHPNFDGSELKQELVNMNIRLARVEELLLTIRKLVTDRTKDI